MDWAEAIKQARARIGPQIYQTPLLRCPQLSALNGGEVWLKLESEQHTGSFKARGALNKVLSLTAEQKRHGLITASTGNHARGFARALSLSGDGGVIVLPNNADPGKVEALRAFPVELRFHGKGCLEAEMHAKDVAAETGMVWVSPYNDALVIAGQGSIGMELTERLEGIDAVLACVGGGGLMSGLSAWLRAASPDTRIVGCLPEKSPEMYLSVAKGAVVIIDEPEDTLSDGSAGGLERGSLTFDICRRNVDDYWLVNEDEIAAAIRFMLDKHSKLVEGSTLR